MKDQEKTNKNPQNIWVDLIKVGEEKGALYLKPTGNVCLKQRFCIYTKSFTTLIQEKQQQHIST